MEDLVRQGIAAVKAGQREHARDLLMRVVEQDEENALAWLWLSGVVDSVDDQEVCLENVLSIEPDNEMARKGLEKLHRQKAEQLMREGVTAAKAGQRERARELLTRAVEYDETNVSAWLWLSGVVDDLDERQACLENVWDLDPGNEVAQRGLALIRKQKEDQPPAPESPLMARARTAVTPAAAILHDDFASQRPPEPEPEPESLTATALKELDDEYLCPYCAAPTEPQDRSCRACRGQLWVKFRKYEKRSRWLWIAIFLQGISTAESAMLCLVFLLVAALSGSEEFSEVMDTYARLTGTSQSTIETWATVAFVVTLLAFLFSLTVLVSLYLRWKPAYYLFVANAALGLFGAAMSVILSFSPTSEVASLVGGNIVCSGFNVLIAGIRLWTVFQMQDDFAYEQRRILLRPDAGMTGASMFLARGHEYVKRKMWALAALHMRRGVAMMPNQIDGRASLILVYLKLKQYDLAAQALEDARRISPGNPQIEELAALLGDARSGS